MCINAGDKAMTTRTWIWYQSHYSRMVSLLQYSAQLSGTTDIHILRIKYHDENGVRTGNLIPHTPSHCLEEMTIILFTNKNTYGICWSIKAITETNYPKATAFSLFSINYFQLCIYIHMSMSHSLLLFNRCLLL